MHQQITIFNSTKMLILQRNDPIPLPKRISRHSKPPQQRFLIVITNSLEHQKRNIRLLNLELPRIIIPPQRIKIVFLNRLRLKQIIVLLIGLYNHNLHIRMDTLTLNSSQLVPGNNLQNYVNFLRSLHRIISIS